MIGAVVLAAGSSFRMGRAKALLKIGEETFLEHVVEVLRLAGIEQVVVVLGHDAPVISKTMTWFKGRVVVNEGWKNGQLSSMVAGLNAFGEHEPHGLLFWPVDHPLVSPEVIAGLLREFASTGGPIVLPEYEERRGHPVIFGANLYDELRRADPGVGARHVVRRHAHEVRTVIVTQPGILLDIDTPEDYREHILSREDHPAAP